MTVEFGGEVLHLLPQRAVHWPAENVLFIADLHLGKASAWLARGIPIPGGATGRDLHVLSDLVQTCGAKRIVILGDVVHGPDSFDAETKRRVGQWRKRHAMVEVGFVTGNHDVRAGELPEAWGFDALGSDTRLGPFLLRHEPPTDMPSVPTLCGHMHPGVILRGPATRGVRLPCFLLRGSVCVLPAFSTFTGLAIVRPGSGDRVFAIAGESVLEPGTR